MPLTKQQIEALFAFTKKKSVQYYDLQVELVDHLASSIEEEMEADGKLTFDAALQKVYSRFGLFGFSHVVQQQEKALRKQSWKLFWKILGSHFTIPRIAFTILLFTALYLAIPFLPGMVQRIAITVGLCYSVFTEIRNLLQRQKTDIKPLLLTKVSNFFLPFSLWTGWLMPKVFDSETTPFHPTSFAVIFTLIIVLQLTAVQINKQIRQKAKELYPEAFSVA